MIINERLIKYFDKHDVISNKQIGFKKKHRASDHMFVLNTIINKYLSKGKKLYCCFVDLQKAFDTVNRTKLIYKLKQTGIGTLLFNVIKDMYIGGKATLSVKIGHVLSGMFKSDIGVYQGDVLSPILFNMYIDDVTQQFDSKCDPATIGDMHVSSLLYADDIVLLSTTEEGLQSSVQKLSAFCKEWDLKINVSKTKVIVFNRGGKLINIKITLDGQVLESAESYKYLGLIFTLNGKMSVAKSDLGKRGSKALFKMKSMFKNASVSYETIMHLFDHVTKPILLYGSDIWGHTLLKNGHINLNTLSHDEIENCHLRCCRYALGVSKKAPTVGIYGETGRYPIAIEAVVNAAKYWHRLQTMDENSLAHKAYTEMKRMHIDDVWTTALESLIHKANVSHDQSQYQLIKTIKSVLQHQYTTYWQHKLFDDKNKPHGNKLRSYRTYKTIFQKEEYLKIKSMSIRSDFARLRLSAHKLHIETGRYVDAANRKDPSDRICSFCTSNICEDEYHFVMKCTLYDDYRQNMIHNMCDLFPNFTEYDDNQRFIWLMSNLNCDVISEFTKYVHSCFVRRKESTLRQN